MKYLLRILELSKNEQRVVLIVVFVLLTFAFIGYERRLYRHPVQQTPATQVQASPSPLEVEHDQ